MEATPTPSNFQEWKRHSKRAAKRPRHVTCPTQRVCCLQNENKQPIPDTKELRALAHVRLRAQRAHGLRRAEEQLLQAIFAKQEKRRVLLEQKQKYRRKRLQQLESRAFSRLLQTLEKEEALAYGGAAVAPVAAAAGASFLQVPSSMAANLTPLQWVGPRSRCESVSALVRATVASAPTPRPSAPMARHRLSSAGAAAAAATPPVLSGLFDQMLIVGLPLESLREPIVSLHHTYTAQIVYTYPEGALCTPAIADFCLPQGVTVTPAAPEQPYTDVAAASLAEMREVLFLLSGGGADGSETSYGMCLHVKRPSHFTDQVVVQAELCYCFISRHPFLPLHLGVLRAMVRMHLMPELGAPALLSNNHSSSAQKGRTFTVAAIAQDLERERQAILQITQVLHRFAKVAVPRPGEEVEFSVFEGIPQALTVPTYFRRPARHTAGEEKEKEEEDDAVHWLREWALPMLLGVMSLDNVLLVLFSMLTEARVVVVCKDLQLLSASVLALTNLLRPMVWAGSLIVTLPTKHLGYLESPVPFIIGVEELPPGFQVPKGIMLVHPDANEVVFHASEAEESRQLVAHQVQWVTASLRETHRELLARTCKGRDGGRASPTRSLATDGTDEEGKHFITPPRAVSPAYRKEARPFSFLSTVAFCTVAAGEECVPAGVTTTTTTTNADAATSTLHHTGGRTTLERRMMEELSTKVRDHVAAVVEVALNIDLVYLPQRPVVDRRRNSVVEKHTLDPETKAWWDECLGGDANGARFMKLFMETQLYTNHRYSDAVRKRDTARLLGSDSFQPHYRSLSPCGGKGATACMTRTAADRELRHHEPLGELFQLAVFGVLLKRNEEVDAVPDGHVDPALQYKPCNGLCGGRSNTPDCTALCLEAWQTKLIHARRKEILREHTLSAATPGKPAFDYQELVTAKPQHSRELPSQYKRRLRLAFGDASLTRKQLWRRKGEKVLYFREYKRCRQEQVRLIHRAASIITSAVRKVAARRERARIVRGITLFQALWRGHARRKRHELPAMKVVQRCVRRYVHHSQAAKKRRQHAGVNKGAGGYRRSAAMGLGEEGEEEDEDEDEDEDEEMEKLLAAVEEEAKKDARGEHQGGGGLWQYLTKRRQENKAARKTAARNHSPVGATEPPTSPRDNQLRGHSPPPSASVVPGKLASSPMVLGHHTPLAPVAEAGDLEDEEEEEKAEGGEAEAESGTDAARHSKAKSPKPPTQQPHLHKTLSPPRGAPTGGGSLSDEEGEDEADAEHVHSRSPTSSPPPPRRRTPMLLQEPSFGRGIIATEKGPLPLQALRRGLRVNKFDRKGRPERRIFYLEDKGSLAYSPRLAWRPTHPLGRLFRHLAHPGKPCHLDLANATNGVDSSCKTPRLILALTNQPPLVRPVGDGAEARYLIFALASTTEPDCAYEFELVPKKGMSTEEALHYYLSLLVTLQTLSCTRGAPTSPSTPKP